MGVCRHEHEDREFEVLGWRNQLVLTGIRMVREEWPKIAAEAERLISAALAETAAA